MKVSRRFALLAGLVLAACAPAAPPSAPPAPAPAPPSRAFSPAQPDGWLHLGAVAPAGRVVPVPGGRGEVAVLRLVDAGGRGGLLEVRCDGPARWREAPAAPQPAAPAPDPAWSPAGTALAAELGAGGQGRLALDLAAGTGDCTLAVRPNGGTAHALTLRREHDLSPALAGLDRGAPDCAIPAPADPVEAVFAAPHGLSLTCPMPLGPTRLLPDALDAFEVKAVALTGRPLGRAALLSGDPDQPIDFSAAPALDLIVVSYLNFNADYTGALMARMLAWHAQRGTVVRILLADPMVGPADLRLLQGLAARHPTVQLQRYRYIPRAGDGFEEHAGRIHRVQHVKLFATIARRPGRSVAMIGGRNLADGYVVDAPFDLAAWPGLRQYRRGALVSMSGFHSYSDLEIALTGDAQVRALVAHWTQLWNRDPATDRPRPATAPAPRPATEGPRMRHFLSVPWADGGAQEGLFAALIDAAERRIDIASPYVNPPPAVAAALQAAVARGVAVRLVTTERVREPGDAFITGVNRLFGADWAGRIAYLDHNPWPSLLHTKAIVIDGRLTYLGSTNLNRRSFLHDLESGLLVLDPGLARRVTALIEGYAADARPIRPDAPVAPLVRALLRLPLVRRMF
jgi:phosphatidylserine/phosphatidylglycerophosphate/cardiolipin synthase-like enzyme